MTYSNSGSKFNKVSKLTPQRKQMPSVFNWIAIKTVAKVLFKETGFWTGMWIFLRTSFWDFIFNRPKWHPEYFELKDAKDEKHFKKIFKELLMVILIFDYLKKKYNEERANEITAQMAIPAGLPYLSGTFKSIKNLKDIDQVRQQMTDYLGDGRGFEWTEEVSEDKTEVRYCFKKCVYIMILRAYGLKSFAGYCCLADHVIFDNVMPELVFGRKHTIGVGDTYCDHMFRIRTPKDQEKDESNYEDCHKVKGGRNAVQQWEENYKKNGGEFKF